MSVAVVSGATIKCTMGLGTGVLNVTSQLICKTGGKPIATVQDIAPMSNIGSCGMCTSMVNPAVASATSAALGVLTPQPCVPSTVGMWTPPKLTKLGGKPCFGKEATLTCAYTGTITIIQTGQTVVMVK